jgi:hypothetical protein
LFDFIFIRFQRINTDCDNFKIYPDKFDDFCKILKNCRKMGDKYNKITDIKQQVEDEMKESEKEQVDPYSELIPPKETPMKKVFIWDPIKEEYNLGTY